MANTPAIKTLLRIIAGSREPIWLPDLSPEKILHDAQALSRAEHAKDLRALIASKIENLRYYDVLNMDSVLAVCHWGRSGSWLVTSYLDGHDDVLSLPTSLSERIYEFLERYQSLSLHAKLIAYPLFQDFFSGDFPIVPADYYAAVAALLEVYTDRSPQLLETRRAFFQFLLVAYSLALNRRPATPHPLMLFALHWRTDVVARRLVEDFPQARFLHTVRDPITCCDRCFEHYSIAKREHPPCWVIRYLTKSDHPHRGMESRTRAIRFEDLHNRPEETMRQLVDWLSLPYQNSLLKSTFNGTPYTVERAGTVWSGARPEQALRSSANIAFTDRALLFALFYENFVAWNYPCPKIFRHALLRGLTCMLVVAIPVKAEVIDVCADIKIQVLPSLRRGTPRVAFRCLFHIFIRRLKMIWFVASEIYRRLIGRKVVLETL